MSIRASHVLAIAFALSCGALASAAQSSAQRAKAFAKLPDWSGLWEPDNGIVVEQDPNAAATQRKIANLLDAAHPPLNADRETAFQAAVKARDFVSMVCVEGSNEFPAIMTDPFMSFELLVTPEETAMLFSKHVVRHVYTDGRSHPAREDLWPTAMGDSVGHWEGDTLVIGTVATKPAISAPTIIGAGDFRMVAIPLGEQRRVTERIRLIDKNRLEDQITFEDPSTFSKPWITSFRYKRMTDINRMIYDGCENDRNPIVDGVYTVTGIKP
jgi:hypothetical protein